jgi:hypothetical protein
MREIDHSARRGAVPRRVTADGFRSAQPILRIYNAATHLVREREMVTSLLLECRAAGFADVPQGGGSCPITLRVACEART